MQPRALTAGLVILALAAGAAGCGDDDETASTGASSGGDDALNAKAQATARTAQAAIEKYAADNNGSYAGASEQELAKIEPSLSEGDLEVVSTDSSYTVSVLSASATTFSIDGEQGGATERTCDPPGGSGCSESGAWG